MNKLSMTGNTGAAPCLGICSGHNTF
ncbi:rCG29107 [Rattus norvegicus]|uniref:RCG29107 n=1 Tax=Rattus norvegicus TaxID=10116 RepID=A6HV37_RAT|nr:rCG29107 [Rattus norvegicus]